MKSYDNNGSGSSYASVGRYRDDTEVFLRNRTQSKPIQFPELVGLAKELDWQCTVPPQVSKANGMFYAKGEGEIRLNRNSSKREIFASSKQHSLTKSATSSTTYRTKRSQARNLLGRLNTLRNSASNSSNRQVPLALTLNCVSKCTDFQNTGVRTTKRLQIRHLLTEIFLRKFT